MYYTEADQVLQTRPRSLKAIRDALDQGSILMPRQRDPVPHYTDVEGSSSDAYLKPVGLFANKCVIELYSRQDGCCDE